MIIEETIFEENGIRAFVEKVSCDSDSSDEEEHKCACGRTVCCGKHKGCCHQKAKIRFISKGKNR